MNKFKEHIPAFVSGVNPTSFRFFTFNGLRKKLKTKFDFPPKGYELCCADERTLMCVTSIDNPSYKFFVRGFVDGIDLTKYLKQYNDEYYTKGRA